MEDVPIEQIESSLVNPETAELVHVNLDFDDGVKGEAYLEPEIVARLQQGDNELLQQLKSELFGTASEASHVLDVEYELPQNNEENILIVNANAVIKRKCESLDSIELEDGSSTVQVVKKQRLTSTLPEPAHIQQVVIYHQEGDIQEAMNNVPTEYASNPKLNETIVKLKVENHMDFSADEKFPLKKKLKRPRRYRKYSLEDRDKATQLVLDGTLTPNQANKQFGIPQSTIFDMIKRVGGSRFRCEQCSKGFPLEYMLEKHRSQHERTDLCSYCAFAPSTRAALRRHIFTSHPREAAQEYGKEFFTYRLTKFKTAKWKPDLTNMLFVEYGKLLQDYTEDSDRDLFKELADIFWKDNFYVTPAQVQRKWRTLLNSYKGFKEGGQKDKQPRFYREMSRFLTENGDKCVDVGEVNEVEDNTREATDNASNLPCGPRKWTDEAVLQLLSLMEERMEQFNEPYVDAVKLWAEISMEICHKGVLMEGHQLQVKWKALKKMCRSKGWDVIPQLDVKSDDQEYEVFGKRVARLISLMDNEKEKGTDIFTTKETGPLSRSGVPKKWSSAFTEAFIDCYDECLEAQELTNESKTKKDMYELISKKLKDKVGGDRLTVHQVENRWSILTRATACYKSPPQDFSHGARMLAAMTRDQQFKEGKEGSGFTPWTDEVHLPILLEEYLNILSNISATQVLKSDIFRLIASNFSKRGLTYSQIQLSARWRLCVCQYKFGEMSEKISAKVKNIIEILEKCETTGTPSTKRKIRNKDSPEKVTQIDATELLMREYGKRLDQFDDSCADDQILWEQIVAEFKAEGYDACVPELENRWESLVEDYKQALREELYDDTQQKKKKRFKYMDQMIDILGIIKVDEEEDDSEQQQQEAESFFEPVKLESIDFQDEENTVLDPLTEDLELEPLLKSETKVDKSDCSSCGKTQEIIQDMIAYLENYEQKRLELENKQTEMLSKMCKKQLSEDKHVIDSDEMVNFVKKFETKRKQMDRAKHKELNALYVEKLNALTELVEDV